MSLVRIGRLGRPHGVRGEMLLDGSSLAPQELEAIGDFTWRGAKGETRPLVLAGVRPADRRLIVSFRGVDDRERAATLTLGELMTERDRLPDPGPETAWTFQLLGLAVVTADGRALGTLADVIDTAAHPIYVVRGERELLVPAAPHVLKRVDLEAGVITVELPAGLEDL